MVRFYINVNIGDDERTVKFWFIHKNYDTLDEDKQQEAWQKALDELNHIYKDYGRFATEVGVCRLFNKFGFERSVR